MSTIGLNVHGINQQDVDHLQRANRLRNFLTQPFFVTQAFDDRPGRRVPMADTVAGAAAIVYTDIARDGMRSGPNLEGLSALRDTVSDRFAATYLAGAARPDLGGES